MKMTLVRIEEVLRHLAGTGHLLGEPTKEECTDALLIGAALVARLRAFRNYQRAQGRLERTAALDACARADAAFAAACAGELVTQPTGEARGEG